MQISWRGRISIAQNWLANAVADSAAWFRLSWTYCNQSALSLTNQWRSLRATDAPATTQPFLTQATTAPILAALLLMWLCLVLTPFIFWLLLCGMASMASAFLKKVRAVFSTLTWRQ